MIERYTNPEMGRLWSDQKKYETWLQVELASVDALVEEGIVPAADAKELRAKANFSVERIDEIEKVTQHDVIAFTTSVAEFAGPSARWLHFGLTSSDVIDTAQALQMRDAADLILSLVDGLSTTGIVDRLLGEIERIDTALFDERVLWITAGKNEHFLRLDIPATPPTTDLPWKGDS